MSDTKSGFFSAAEAWLCDGYALDIRYVGEVHPGGLQIWGASIGLHPLEADRDLSFSIRTECIVAGQRQSFPVTKVEALEILRRAADGSISLPDLELTLPLSSTHDFHSEMHQRDRWFSQLHLQIGGARIPPPSSEKLLRIDNELRVSTMPFDGLDDLSMWLGIGIPALTGVSPMVVLRANPPVDLILDQCGLANDELRLVLHAHASFDVGQVGIAVRGIPGVGLQARLRAADRIAWGGRGKEDEKVLQEFLSSVQIKY